MLLLGVLVEMLQWWEKCKTKEINGENEGR
jgi:hypothetical protein